MSMTDTVADMLTRIRNANMVRHERVEIPASKLKAEVARILHEEGYIQSYRLIEDRKQGILRIYLKYDDNQEKVISGIRRISKPGRRVYASAAKIPRVYGDKESAAKFSAMFGKRLQLGKRGKHDVSNRKFANPNPGQG